MAVLVEAGCVIVRTQTVQRLFKDDLSKFYGLVPNSQVCTDGKLIRVGFMHSNDALTFIDALQKLGFIYKKFGKSVDIVLADQVHGLHSECDWLEFGYASGEFSRGNKVAVARMVGDGEDWFAAPDGWEYEGSMSQRTTYISQKDIPKSLEFVEHQNGLDIYLDKSTGTTKYVGRSYEAGDTPSNNRVAMTPPEDENSYEQRGFLERAIFESPIVWMLSSIVAGYLIHRETDFTTALICAVGGVAFFLFYGWVRATMWANDPVQRLSIAARGKPRGTELERVITSFVIPFGGAYLIKAIFFAQ